MQHRREFLKSVATVGVAGAVGAPATTSVAQTVASAAATTDDRDYWLAVLRRIATPVLASLARRDLKRTMPVEATRPAERAKYTHLEPFGRLIAGIASSLA